MLCEPNLQNLVGGILEQIPRLGRKLGAALHDPQESAGIEQ